MVKTPEKAAGWRGRFPFLNGNIRLKNMPNNGSHSETDRTPGKKTLPLPEALKRALALVKAGKSKDGELMLRAILEAKPDHFDSLHLLGVQMAMQKKFDEAVALLTKASPSIQTQQPLTRISETPIRV